MKEANKYFALVPERGRGGSLKLRAVDLDEHIKGCLRASILTHVGELSLTPELGSAVRDHLFRPLTVDTLRDIEQDVTRAIRESEPRVETVETKVTADKEDRSKILVEVQYRILETQKLDSLKLSVTP